MILRASLALTHPKDAVQAPSLRGREAEGWGAASEPGGWGRATGLGERGYRLSRNCMRPSGRVYAKLARVSRVRGGAYIRGRAEAALQRYGKREKRG